MNQLSKISYNYIKSIKDKEQKVLSYYKRINSVEQPRILVIPKRKKGTKKNTDTEHLKKKEEENKELLNKEYNEDKEDKQHKIEMDKKKLTKKRIVDMGD